MLSQIKHGDVLLVSTKIKWNKPTSWVVGLIRFFTKSKWNHAELIIEKEGKFYAYESLSGGVVVSDIEKETKGDIKILRAKFEFDANKLITIADNYIEKSKYDYWNLFIWQPLFRITGIWFGTDTPNKVLCSEFVIRSLIWASKDIQHNLAKYEINLEEFAPADLEDCSAFDSIIELDN